MAEIASFGVNVDQNTRLAQNAQDTADEANSGIKNINDPNYLSPFEKPHLEIQMDNFAANYTADKDIATAEGIDFAAYDAAYQAYLAYMTPLIADMTTYSPIVRSTFNGMVTAVQTEQKRFSTATQAQYNQQINQAQTDIANGQTRYQALQSDAETMKSSVASISDAADRAISSAGFASNAASTASQAANEASQAASSALASAMGAQNDASSAVTKAESTASEFGKVSQKTDSAVANALSAQSSASDAVKQASSAAADSKDAKQIAGAVRQSYKTLTDGSTMTIAELEGGLAVKLTKKDLDGYATETWAQNQIKTTADGINGTLSSVKSTVDSQTTSINDLKADSSSFKSQFTKVNNTLGMHTTDIGSLQASSKELISNFDSLSTANGTNEHNISQLQQNAKGFSSTLETVQTQVQDSAVGTNLLANTADNGVGPVSVQGDTSSPVYNATMTRNSSYIEMTNATRSELYYRFCNTDSGMHNLKPGQTYTIQGEVYVSKGTVHFRSQYQVNGGWTDYPDCASGDLATNTSGFTKVNYTFTIPENATAFYLSWQVYDYDSTTIFRFRRMKLEKGSLATDWCPNPADTATVTALTKVKQTADGAQVLATNNNGDIANLQATTKGLQSTVSDKASSDQLTQLSGQLTNEIKDLSSSTSSKFTQTSKDINAMVKKGDVVNQFNIDTGGALLSTTGNSTKIVFSSPNIVFDTANPVQIPNANIVGTLTGKTFEAGTITATTKIISSDIEASLIHSKDNSFSLNGATGDIVGPSIHAADNSWGISNAGKIHGTSITASVMDISGDGSGPNFDAKNVTPDTTTGIYSGYKYTNPNVGFDVNGMGRKMYKNGYLVINGDTFLNRTIGDWSADGGGKYVYDTMYEANVIKMRAYDYTGSNVQTDDPSSTEGSISSRLDIQPSAITMGRDWSVGNPNILIDNIGRIKGGLIATNANHSIGTTDGGGLYFMRMNKNATNVDGSSISIHVKKLYQSSLLSLKTDIKPIDPHEALTEVVKNDVMGYHFKNDKTADPKSVSVILDDINPIPKYYTSDIFKSADGTGRNDGNIVGYLMLSIKDLNSRLQKLEGTN